MQRGFERVGVDSPFTFNFTSSQPKKTMMLMLRKKSISSYQSLHINSELNNNTAQEEQYVVE